jgi:hypothetical protein
MGNFLSDIHIIFVIKKLNQLLSYPCIPKNNSGCALIGAEVSQHPTSVLPVNGFGTHQELKDAI